MTKYFGCQQVVSSMYDFIDGALPQTQRLTFESHLRSCSWCDNAHQFETRLRAVVQQRTQVEPPPELGSRIAAILQAENQLGTTPE